MTENEKREVRLNKRTNAVGTGKGRAAGAIASVESSGYYRDTWVQLQRDTCLDINQLSVSIRALLLPSS